MQPPLVVLCLLAAAWPTALCQNPVPIQFQTSPVLVRTGAAAVLEVVTVSDALSVSWVSPTGITLGLWVGGQAVLDSVGQYMGRITITAMKLQISPVLPMDAGNYTVIVDPGNIVGMTKNSRSVLLRVFDAVDGVKLSVPPIAIEGGNISLTCTWTMGTQTSTIWEKGGTAISSGNRITVTDKSLVINPSNRSDAGVYSCTVTNLVSAMTATASLTVYYGPDAPILQQNSQANCVGGGQTVVGQTVQLTCTSVSLPPALFSWQQNSQSVAADQVNGGVLTLQDVTTNQSGRYVCMARNAVTTQTATQSIDITIVKMCLSAGAVAGIAVGCALVVIFIIIAIILLLCCRNRDSRGNKPNPSSVPVTGPLQPATQSSFWNRAPGWSSDPPLHSPNMLPDARQQYARTSPPLQPNSPNTRGLQGNPAGTISNHGRPDTGGLPSSGLYGPESPQNRTHTGHGPPGSVPPLINLTWNTIQPTEHSRNDGQPQAIHLNLNAYPYLVQPTSFQNSNALHINPNNVNTPQQANHHTPESGLSPTIPVQRAGGDHSAPPISTSSVESQAPTRDAVIQTGFTHVVNYGRIGQQDARTQTYWSEASLLSRPQRPWDWVRSTPAYPNCSVVSQRRSPSNTWSSSEPRAAQLGNNPQNNTAPNPNPNPNTAPNPNPNTAPAAQGPQSETAPKSHSQTHVSINTQTNNPDPQGFKVTWVPTPLIQTAPQNKDAQTPAALPAHTTKPHNPFQTLNQPTQTVVAQRTKPSARRPPTPPPVLPFSQFKALPRQHLPEPRPTQQLRPQRKPHPKRTIGIVQPSPDWKAVHGPGHMHSQPHPHMHVSTQKQVFRSRMRY